MQWPMFWVFLMGCRAHLFSLYRVFCHFGVQKNRTTFADDAIFL